MTSQYNIMMRVTLLLYLLAGCTAGSSNAPAKELSRETWQLRVTVSGGFAGLDQQFAVNNASNQLLATDSRLKTQASQALATAERQQLATLVAARAAAPDVNSKSAACADCYQYEMTIQQRGKARVVRYDSTTLSGTADEPLINRMILLGRAALMAR
jgi:hypothetical protein